MRVDVHTHYVPEGYRELLRQWNKSVRIEEQDGADVIVDAARTFTLSPGFVDLDARVEWMDEHGIDHTLVSVSSPSPNEAPFTTDESTELVRAINDGFADLQRQHPDRVSGLGAIPLRDPEAAIQELGRIEELGLAGVTLPTRVGERTLSHPAFRPVFETIDDLDVTVFLHPKRNALQTELDADEERFNPLVVFPAETTLQVARMIFDGFFDRHDFDLVLSHLGGALPYLVGRLERGREQFSADGPPDRPVQEYVQEFYYDTITFHPPAIRAAIDTVGADHLLLGTDYPYGMESAAETIEDLNSVGLTREERKQVMGGTARALFDL